MSELTEGSNYREYDQNTRKMFPPPPDFYFLKKSVIAVCFAEATCKEITILLSS